jgi:hypothetical protein
MTFLPVWVCIFCYQSIHSHEAIKDLLGIHRERGRGNKERNRGRNGNSQNVGNLNNDFSASTGMCFSVTYYCI